MFFPSGKIGFTDGVSPELRIKGLFEAGEAYKGKTGELYIESPVLNFYKQIKPGQGFPEFEREIS